MGRTMGVALLARGKGDVFIGVTAAGRTPQSVDAHHERLVFLTYVDTAETTGFTGSVGKRWGLFC